MPRWVDVNPDEDRRPQGRDDHDGCPDAIGIERRQVKKTMWLSRCALDRDIGFRRLMTPDVADTCR